MGNAELFRLLCNLIRVGVVSELDLSDSQNPRVRVLTGGNTTDWVRWLTSRAGNARRWCAPVIGEQVLLAAPDGDLSKAVILGAFYGADFPPPDNGASSDVVTWSDGASCRYDMDSGALSVSGVKSVALTSHGPVTIDCTTATVQAESSVTLDAPEVICTQKLTAAELSITKGGELHGAFTGSMTINGVKPDDHDHGGVQTGEGWTSEIK
ncbi:hypothetical protein GCM10022405_41230 [Gibbsiella dentisursi]|uniref:Phage baseplate assembly protein V n=1 Tax=Gibbsiella dentisursi TaxID=796890 RepID=A0ABP7M094_9GAMM